MKTVIAYYTLYGSSAVVAHVLSDNLHCDVVELEEAKSRSKGVFGFIHAGFQAASSRKTKLNIDVKEKFGTYERIIIITPIWANRSVPAVNTLISELDFTDKRVIVLTIQGDPEHTGAPKVAASIQQRVEEKGGKMIAGYYLHSKSLKTPVSVEDIKPQLEGFLEAYKPLD